MFSNIDIDLFGIQQCIDRYWICEVCVYYRGLKLVNVQFYFHQPEIQIQGQTVVSIVKTSGFIKGKEFGLSCRVWYVSSACVYGVLIS